MRAAAPNALLIVSGDAHTFAVWYARYGLNVRPDVAVVNDSLLAFDWYRRTLQTTHPELGGVPSDVDSLLAASLPARPVELTDAPSNIPVGLSGSFLQVPSSVWCLRLAFDCRRIPVLKFAASLDSRSLTTQGICAPVERVV